ncbi:MAG: hypothetical protein ACRCW2_14875 [Cellulosilyticaceae bacterium]
MKLRLLAVVALSVVALAGCGSKADTPAETAPATGQEVRKVEIPSDKDTIVTEVTFEEGKPVNVEIDIIMEDGSSKYEAAAAGEYVMVEGAENTWDKQVDALEAFIEENNFDLSKVTVDENGKTDVVTGVSVSVPNLIEGINQILAEAN